MLEGIFFYSCIWLELPSCCCCCCCCCCWKGSSSTPASGWNSKSLLLITTLRSMGGLCNGKLGGKFNEVFSELMEGDLSEACRYFALSCFAAFSLIDPKHRLQSIPKDDSWDHRRGSRPANRICPSSAKATQRLLLSTGWTSSLRP